MYLSFLSNTYKVLNQPLFVSHTHLRLSLYFSLNIFLVLPLQTFASASTVPTKAVSSNKRSIKWLQIMFTCLLSLPLHLQYFTHSPLLRLAIILLILIFMYYDIYHRIIYFAVLHTEYDLGLFVLSVLLKPCYSVRYIVFNSVPLSLWKIVLNTLAH